VEYVETLAQLPGVVAAVGAATQNLVLVERFLGGREFCIAVMGAGPGGVLAFSAVERCLDEGEKVFTSMDVRPITESRVQLLEGGDDPEQVALVEALGDLAKGVYTGFNLTSLVRLDIRQDVDGKLYILVSAAGGVPNTDADAGDWLQSAGTTRVWHVVYAAYWHLPGFFMGGCLTLTLPTCTPAAAAANHAGGQP
jgi:hypothetical protein